MSTLPSGASLRPVTIPARISDPDAVDFVEMTRIRNDLTRAASGTSLDEIAAEELLPFLRSTPDAERRVWLIDDDGRAVGRAGLDIPLEKGSRVASWYLALPDRLWATPIAAAVLVDLERRTAAAGRTVLQTSSTHRPQDLPAIGAPTGFGELPRDGWADFLEGSGYRLEQIVRCSVLEVDEAMAELPALLAAAEAASPEYDIVQWWAPTPPEFVEDYAWMKSRMSLDDPSAGLEVDEEIWDAARVARSDERFADANAGRAMQVTAARHRETGRLCAMNELAIGRDRAGVTHQNDTLVLAEHRGNRLGMRVKCAGLQSWHAAFPDSPRVVTYNAEENRPMLDVNERIGFAPAFFEGQWQKVLG